MICSRLISIPIISLFVVLFSAASYGLDPQEVLVLANRNARDSVGLAKYYMGQRRIPETHLLQLQVTEEEHCTRDEYDKRIVTAVRRALAQDEFKRKIRCLVVFYGLPLRVESPNPSPAGKSRKPEPDKPLEQGASLDSELALVLAGEYPLSKWVPNPFFIGHQGKYVKGMPEKGEVLMVSRLDGPDTATVRRMIDDSVRVEEEGLKGIAYFDARWPKPQEDSRRPEVVGYEFYDRSIHAAAEAVRNSGRMTVQVNDREELFMPGECPQAALYCGWYSLGQYVDAFGWVPGAVGYHIASAECVTLKKAGSQVWCKRMLEEGVSATLGPVAEPYVQAFPVPELFFSLLVGGYWTLAECYALSQPFWSWQMVLLGDPLYRPFAKFQNSVDRSRKTD